jgi:hypothetical protein
MKAAVSGELWERADQAVEAYNDMLLDDAIRLVSRRLDRYEVKYGPGSPKLNFIEVSLNTLFQDTAWFRPNHDGPSPNELLLSYSTAWITVAADQAKAVSTLEVGWRRYDLGWWAGERLGLSAMLRPRYVSAGLLIAEERDGALRWPFNSVSARATRLGRTHIRDLKVGYLFGPEEPTAGEQAGCVAAQPFLRSRGLGGILRAPMTSSMWSTIQSKVRDGERLTPDEGVFLLAEAPLLEWARLRRPAAPHDRPQSRHVRDRHQSQLHQPLHRRLPLLRVLPQAERERRRRLHPRRRGCDAHDGERAPARRHHGAAPGGLNPASRGSSIRPSCARRGAVSVDHAALLLRRPRSIRWSRSRALDPRGARGALRGGQRTLPAAAPRSSPRACASASRSRRADRTLARRASRGAPRSACAPPRP